MRFKVLAELALVALVAFAPRAHATCSTLSTTNPNSFPLIWGFNPSLGSGTQTFAPVAENSDCTIGGSSSGGGGAITAANGSYAAGALVDGADLTQGTKADAAWGLTGSGSLVAIDKEIALLLNSPLAVTGTFFQATQPVSIAAAPPPTYPTVVATSQMGLTVATATSLTVPGTAKCALIAVEGNSVRWRDDGTAPTATVGWPMAVGSSMKDCASLSAIQFIQTAATATIDVSYYNAP